MGSTVAFRVSLLLLCLAVGDAVRQASMHQGDGVGAVQEYEKQEHERVEHEHAAAEILSASSSGDPSTAAAGYVFDKL